MVLIFHSDISKDNKDISPGASVGDDHEPNRPRGMFLRLYFSQRYLLHTK